MLTAPFAALVFLTFVTLVAIPCNLFAIALLRPLDRVRAPARSTLLLLLLAAPWLIGGGVLISSVVDILFGACNGGQVCLWNNDPRLVSPARMLFAVPVLLALAGAVIRLSRQLLHSRRAILALTMASVPDDAADTLIIPSGAAMAFAAHGRVFISRGLIDKLTKSELQAVLLHERAHLQRSDSACLVIALVLSCMLLPPVRRRLLDALGLANEQACDEEAALVTGRLETARAILNAERLAISNPPMLCPAFSESFVPLRVRRLLQPRPPAMRQWHVYCGIIGATLSVFLVGDLLYYGGMIVLYPGLL